MDEKAFAEFKEKFVDAICDDLNTSMAITVVYDMLKADINDKTKLALARDFDRVLSLDLTTAGAALEESKTDADEELVSYIEDMIAQRAKAKKAKDVARADVFRD